MEEGASVALPKPSRGAVPKRARKRGAAAPGAAVPSIFETLRVRISQQHIPPGAKLRETDLAEEFGVPRTRIRDALAALEQRGLVERIPNRGAVVIRLDLSQALHIYDVRSVLEGLAARLATENTKPEHWKPFLERFEKHNRKLIEHGDLDAYIEEYERLRRAITDAAANPVLAQMMDTMHEKTQVLIRRIIILPGRAEIGRTQHVEMLRAMCRGDGAEAERVRRTGLGSAQAALEKYQRYIL
jgi:DNA-binding GntR family transcriptional regulator